MAVINETTAKRMLAEARARWGLAIDDWWLGDAATVAAWFKSGAMETGDAMAMPCGNGVVVWLMSFVDGANCDCRGIGLDGRPGEIRKAKDIHKAFDRTRFVAWFDPRLADRKARTAEEARPIRLGSRLCIRIKGSGDWRLAMVTSLTPLVVALEIGESSPRYELATISDKWFAPRNRDAGFDSLWGEGKVQWSAYIAMLSALSKRQKRVAPADYEKAKAAKM